ncbi:MAG: Hsp70 family protein, partial [Acidobacteriota bacterium]|nr:Hsp70 family protein [Acidobacteriota bacterium]
VVDNQQSVEIHILQGEREIASANRSLGKFELVGIPPAPRGVPQIDVSFEIDANGIVNVSALDKMTGLEQAMQITPSSGLSPEEIDRLIMEAETSTETDRLSKQLILQRNRLDTLIKNTQKSLSEFARTLSAEQQQEINAVLNDAEAVLETGDLDEIERTLIKVEQAANQLTMLLMAAV